MSTPTKTPGLPQGIITPSCDITPTRETARDDAAYDDFALSQNDCSELPRDDASPTSAPAVSVEPAYDGAEPSPAGAEPSRSLALTGNLHRSGAGPMKASVAATSSSSARNG